MATIVDEFHRADLRQLSVDLQKALPAYARPVFLRFVDKLDMTGGIWVKLGSSYATFYLIL